MEHDEPNIAPKNFYSTEWRCLMELVKYFEFDEDRELLWELSLDHGMALIGARLIERGLDPHTIFKAVGVEQ